jgi:EmrB/QacA subfamily drug resistance transporter
MRRYLIFAVASLAVLLCTIDATAVSVAFPVIVSSLHVSLIVAGWVLSAYQLAVTATIPLAGKISDALGRKTTFLGFLSLFAVGSLLCSIAPNAPLLIVFRVIQGLGGSGLIPSTMGIIADEFPNSRQRAIGLITSFGPIGWIVGPNLGGWMTSSFGWRSIFWINIPLCAIAFISAVALMAKGQREKTRIDLTGAGLLAGGLLGILAGISEMGSTDKQTPWWLVGLLFVAGITGLILFWRRQTRVKDPIIEPEVLKGRPFMAANVFNLGYGLALGAVSLIPLYAVSIYGMTTLQSGLILTPRSIGMIAASTVTALAIVRLGYRWPMLTGVSLMVPAFLFLALEPGGFSGASFLLIVAGVLGIAQGIASPASNNACIELMPHRVATISATRSLFRQAGQVFIITIGSLLLHNLGIVRGFRILFIGLPIFMLVTMIPAIFMMPRSPTGITKVKSH